MSVSNETNKVRTQGDGAQVAFSFAFKIFSKTDLEVYKVVRATDVETLMTVDVDYTVAINTVTEGGTVTFTVAPTSLQDAFIKRVLDLTQPTVIPTESNFPEKSVENELDRGRMIDIQQQEEIDRCIKQDPLSEDELTLPAAEADKYLGWNAAGDALENKSAPTNVDYAGTISKGLDADKPASPSASDIYFATDTNILYRCATAGTWSNITNGNKGTNILSATSIDLGAATGDVVDVTGSTTINSLGTARVGTVRKVRFTGALTLTYNATSLILPGAASITTAAGDCAEFVSLGSGNWFCSDYERASGAALVGSNTVNGNYILEGYATGRCVLRKIRLRITPGGTPGTNLNVVEQTGNGLPFNAPTITSATNLGKSGSSGSFTLDAGGTNLVMNLTPDVICVLACTIVVERLNNASVAAGDIWFPNAYISSGNLGLQFLKAGLSSQADITGMTPNASDQLDIDILFVTST